MSRYDPSTIHRALDLNIDDYSQSDDDESSNVESIEVDDDKLTDMGLSDHVSMNHHNESHKHKRRQDLDSSNNSNSFRFSTNTMDTNNSNGTGGTGSVTAGAATMTSAMLFSMEHPNVSFGDDDSRKSNTNRTSRNGSGSSRNSVRNNDIEGGGGEGERGRGDAYGGGGRGKRSDVGGTLAPEVERYGLESTAEDYHVNRGANNGKQNQERRSRMAHLGDAVSNAASKIGRNTIRQGSLRATAIMTKVQKDGKRLGSAQVGSYNTNNNHSAGEEKGKSWLPSWFGTSSGGSGNSKTRDIDLDDRSWFSGFDGGADYGRNNPHDDESDDDYEPNHRLTRRLKRGVAVVFVIATVTVSSAIIGFSIPGEESALEGGENGGDGALYTPVRPGSLDNSPGKDGKEAQKITHSEEDLLIIAESVVQKCDEKNLKQIKGRQDCQTICHDHLCCFDDEEDGYNCLNDENKLCSVYAGCESLVFDLTTLPLPSPSPSGKTNESSNGDAVLVDDAESNGEDEVAVEVAESNGEESEGNEQLSNTKENHIDTIAKDDNKSSKTREEDESANNAPGDGTKDAKVEAEKESDDAKEDAVGNLGEKTEQDLLEVAESINRSCSVDSLKTETGKSECETLCHDHLCCFDDESSCEEDESKMCMVYVGCRDMLEIPML